MQEIMSTIRTMVKSLRLYAHLVFTRKFY